MPNGFHGNDEDWKQIERPLQNLDPVLEKFATTHGLELKKNNRNWPDRSFEWGEAPRVLIQIYLESEDETTYTMWASASDKRSRETYWQHKTFVKSERLDAIGVRLESLLEEAFLTAQRWVSDYSAS